MRFGWLFFLCFVAMPVANAQSFPEKSIKLVVPFTPGGSSDIVARAMADGAAEALGQAVVVDNVPGASGNVGTARVAKSPADGYTLVQCTIGTCSINGSLYSNPGFDVLKDFEPVFLVGGVMNVFTVTLGFPAKTMNEMVSWAKVNPGKLTYGSSGVGASNHLAPEWLAYLAGISMVHAPYKGSGPAIVDLIGGQIMMFNDNEPSILPQIKTGKVRALAVTGPQRSANLPDIPTMEEAGYKGFVVEPWFGYMVPKGTPPAVIAKLNSAFNAAVQMPRVKSRLEAAGVRIVAGSPDRLGDLMKTETERWGQVIRANKIHPN
jgi:tripartite-type tricarboxylate transporter receptor subunit TctC